MKLYKATALCSLLMLLLSMSPFLYASPSPASELDLANWKLDTLKELKGPWDFYPGILLEPGTPLPSEPPLAVATGDRWNNFTDRNGQSFGSFGFGTYRLVLKNLSPHPASYQIYLPPAGSAFRAFAYPLQGKGPISEAHSGHVAQSLSEERGSKHWGELRLHPAELSDYVVLIQVSNFHQKLGGYWATPYLATAQSAGRIELLMTLQTVFSMGILAGLGFYSFIIWYRHREQKASLYLALGGITALIRMWSTTDTLAVLLPESAYSLLHKLEYVSMPSGVFCFFAALSYSFSKARLPKSIFRLMLALAVLLCFIPFLFSQNLYTRMLPLFQLYILLAMILEAIILWMAFRKSLSGVGITLLGVFLVFFGLTFDLLAARGVIQSPFYLTSLAIAIYLVLQAEAVAERAALAYARVERLTIELKEKERARTLFFHNTSHELRTPLNGIIGFLELVSKGHFGVIATSVQDPIQKALRLAESLKVQVNTILDLAKAKRGELDLRPQHFLLAELKRDADQLAEGLSLKSTLLSYHSSLECQTPEFIGDREKIFTLLRNLLGNAFKFRDPQRPNQVSLTLTADAEKLRISVSDTGIGIPPEFQSKIFEEFTQLQGDVRRAYEGTGLGLAMVRDLTRVMEGQITLESELGKGTRMTIEIPRHTESLPPSLAPMVEDRVIPELASNPAFASPSVITQTPELTHNQHSADIYIIDDNESNCEVMEGLLRLEGHHVRHAVSGRIGLEELRQRRCDLLLLDMMMPEMSGEDVMQVMREDPLLQDIPIILITARASEEDRISGLRLGADDYLAKPIVSAELKLRVKNMIERHHLLREISDAGPTEKLLQLGEMFGELSHELKNILNSSATLQALKRDDIILSLAVLPFPEASLREATAAALLAPELTEKFQERMDKLAPLELNLPNTYIHSLKYSLCSLALSESDRHSLWQTLPQFSEDELTYFSSQLALFSQYKQSLATLQSSRELTLSVLSYTRPDDSHARLDKVWEQTLTLLRGRLRKHSVQWKVQLLDLPLAISQSRLTQVLINLIQNALDAMEPLASELSWIEVVTLKEGDTLILRISNAGPPISLDLQTRLFQRGVTSKGKRGSGIGLYVSRRYLKDAAGDLSYDSNAAHPCFVLRVPLARD